LRQLQLFAAVARTGSTTAAGASIGLTQSATSSAVNELERVLVARLFDRVGKRLLLNDNGRALLPRALAVLDGASGLERLVRHGVQRLEDLRIGASTTIGSYVLPKMLAQFLGNLHRDDVPTWKSSVMIGNSASVCSAVAAFELDIGLIEGPCHQPSLRVMPWIRDSLVIVASAALLREASKKSRRNTIPLSELRKLVWLLRESGSGTREATDQWLLPHLHDYPRSLELGSSEAIKHASAFGLGAACLSSWVVRDLLVSGALSAVATALPAFSRQCFWVVHRDKQWTPALREFIEHLSRPDAVEHAQGFSAASDYNVARGISTTSSTRRTTS
jgi:DNA-binding transcriptional LysR family regulator